MVKGVIFDLDGTLINSKIDLGNAMNRILLKHDFPIHPMGKYVDFIGRGIKNLVAHALPELQRNPEMIELCKAEMMEDYGRNCMVDTYIYEGIPELLDELQKQGNVSCPSDNSKCKTELSHRLSLSVFSNKPHELTVKIMENLFSSWKFDYILGASDDYPRKPDPTGVFRICESLGLKSSELLYVGDSGVDMETAARADIKSVGVTWGFRPQSELEKSGAWKIVHHPKEIKAFVR